MVRLGSLLRGNPHFLNFAILTVVGLVPVMLYASAKGPTEEEKLRRSRERDPDPAATAARMEQFRHFFGKARKPGAGDKGELDEVFDELVRGGAGSVQKRRGHNYEGSLADAERADRERQLAMRYGIDAAKSAAPSTSSSTATPPAPAPAPAETRA